MFFLASEAVTPGEGFLETDALRGSLSMWQEGNSWALGNSGGRNECEAIGELGTQQNVPRVFGGPGKRYGRAGASLSDACCCLIARLCVLGIHSLSRSFLLAFGNTWEICLSLSHSIYSFTQLFTYISVVSWLSYCTFNYNHIQRHLVRFWLLGLLGYSGLLCPFATPLLPICKFSPL